MVGRRHRLATTAIHAGEPHPRIGGSLVMPIFQSSVFESQETERRRVGVDGSTIPAHERYRDLRYVRLSNTPNHLALQGKLAALESAEAAVVTSSGMAAISSALLTVLSPGDHLLAESTLYGGTLAFITHELSRLGIQHDWIDAADPVSWERKIRPETKLIYVETLSNPLVRVPELSEVVRFARAHGILAAVDNTFATPVNYSAVQVGFDLSIHSCTKYLGGHSDLLAGCVLGSQELVFRILSRLADYGGCLNPLDCYLLHRSLKTLSLRVERHNANALGLARYLSGHEAVRKVFYPGLAGDPDHRRGSQFLRGFGGVLAFELRGGAAAAISLFETLKLATVAPSLGGIETTLTRPASTSHFNITPTDRVGLGITDGLVRLSVGLEAVEDLIEDFDSALRSDTPEHR